MTFDEILAQVQELLQREQRVSYRGLVTARQLITGFRKMAGDGFRNSNPRETCCV